MTLRHVPRFARTDTPRTADAPTAEEEAEKLVTVPARRAAAKRFREVEFTNWLIREHELEPEHARAMAVRLLSSTPRIRGAFQKWWLTGRVEDIEVGGHSFRELVHEQGMSPFGALLSLSLLESHGERAYRELEVEADGDPDLCTTLRMVSG